MFYVTCRDENCLEDVPVTYDMVCEKTKCVCGAEYVVDYDEFYDSETGDEDCVWYLRTPEEWNNLNDL